MGKVDHAFVGHMVVAGWWDTAATKGSAIMAGTIAMVGTITTIKVGTIVVITMVGTITARVDTISMATTTASKIGEPTCTNTPTHLAATIVPSVATVSSSSSSQNHRKDSFSTPLDHSYFRNLAALCSSNFALAFVNKAECLAKLAAFDSVGPLFKVIGVWESGPFLYKRYWCAVSFHIPGS